MATETTVQDGEKCPTCEQHKGWALFLERFAEFRTELSQGDFERAWTAFLSGKDPYEGAN